VEVKKEKKAEPKKEKKEQKKQKVVEPAKVEKKIVPKEGMMKDLEEQISEMNLTEELFSNEQIRIELLRPKTEKDFIQFSQIISDKILESEDLRKLYMELLKDIITNTTVNLKSAELRDIQSHVTSLAQKRLEDEKNAKKPQQVKKCKKNEF
jgi:hypothetical protein